MRDVVAQISQLAEKVRRLEERMGGQATPHQLREIAEEAASYHRLLALALISNAPVDRKELITLSQQFGNIELTASIRHYNGIGRG